MSPTAWHVPNKHTGHVFANFSDVLYKVPSILNLNSFVCGFVLIAQLKFYLKSVM